MTHRLELRKDILEKIYMYLHFILFLDTEEVRVAEIQPQRRQESSYIT